MPGSLAIMSIASSQYAITQPGHWNVTQTRTYLIRSLSLNRIEGTHIVECWMSPGRSIIRSSVGGLRYRQ